MYKICQTENSQKRQWLIEETLLDLMRKNPYNEITISALCAQADIPRKAFYRYFDTKEDVLHALIDHMQMRYLYEGPAGPTGYDEVVRMYTFWYEHRELLDVLFNNNMEGLWYSRMIDKAIEERVGARYAQHKGQSDAYRLMTTFTIGGLLSCVVFCHRLGWKKTTQEMAEITTDLLTKPLYDLQKNNFAEITPSE